MRAGSLGRSILERIAHLKDESMNTYPVARIATVEKPSDCDRRKIKNFEHRKQPPCGDLCQLF
jgi:hypothetical protein